MSTLCRSPRRSGHLVLLAILAIVLGGLLPAPAARADTAVSPTSATAGETATFVVRVTDDGVDLVSSVSAGLSGGAGYVGCGAPDGWSCSGGDGQVRWERETSLTPDDTFTMTLVMSAEPGELVITSTDTRASGASSSSTTTVIVEPAPEPEPTEEPTATDEPTENEDEDVDVPDPDEPSRPTPPLEPFRPPDEDGPISIRDLPDEVEPADDATDEAEAAPAKGGGPGLTTFILAPLAALLALSATGFLMAEANR